MKVALVIGHNARSQGAYSKPLGLTEYNYYKQVAMQVKRALTDEVEVFERFAAKSYVSEMSTVVNKLNSTKFDYIIELHFNAAANVETQGCECLVHYKSNKAIKLANDFLTQLTKQFRNLRNRGLIKIENSSQRGGYGICNTVAPYILIEPFFGSNDKAKEFDIDTMSKFLIDFIKGAE